MIIEQINGAHIMTQVCGVDGGLESAALVVRIMLICGCQLRILLHAASKL